MDHLTPSFALLLDLFRPCFRAEVFALFRLTVAAWVVCLGRRTISRVWETTGQATLHSHCRAFRLFSQAVWNWDELGRILLVKFLALLVPGGRVWLVVDDTLCHKRGARVAFGGIFLDPVLSSRRSREAQRHKVFRFGTNWVTLGLVLQLPFRRDRFWCVNILWRLYAKKDPAKATPHRTKSQWARDMVEQVARWLPGRPLTVVGDSAYVGQHLLKGLPEHVAVIGSIHPQAVLSEPLPPDYRGRRKKGEPLTTPQQAFDEQRWPWRDVLLDHPKGQKKLQVKVGLLLKVVF